MPIILASGSATRRKLLDAAGISVHVDPPDVDEAAIKRDCSANKLNTAETAETLARAKAAQIARRHPGKIVIGADQMLECGGRWFDKPADRSAAAMQISALSGKTHRLVSAIVVFRGDREIWRTTDSAELAMRPISPAFIDSYLDRIGDQVLSSVGGYQIEGLGIQLFSRISGDHFTILGLPILPLLAFLRDEKVILQ
jgi:septum formation protein